ncbi:MAG TPA: DNA gyrase inhibitor YacG [Anaeromyxobacter sp.]|nr:DNA gyrase inhibitor YacG [Anaeromyxobacter sp.]
MATSPPCPICSQPAPLRPVNRDYPFCSPRCRLVDLGRWLGEEYRISAGRAGDGGEAPGRPEEREEEDA